MPYVKPFVKGNKNYFVNSGAICAAAAWPAMRFVTPKSEAQQGPQCAITRRHPIELRFQCRSIR